MSTLMENAQQHVVSMMENLTGDEDFMPFMTIRAHDGGIVYAGLMMPEGDSAKSRIGDIMMALCAIHRATEVVFVSTSWMVMRKMDDQGEPEEPIQGPASEQPDRVEAVFMTSIAGSLCEGTIRSAPVIRENNTVRLGEWSDWSQVGVTGKFGDAIITGMKFGEKFPPDMCEYVDAEIAAGRDQNLVESMLRAINTARTGAFKN